MDTWYTPEYILTDTLNRILGIVRAAQNIEVPESVPTDMVDVFRAGWMTGSLRDIEVLATQAMEA